MEAEALVENNGRITLKLFGSQQGCPSHYRPRVQGPTGRVNSKEGLPESLRPWAVLPGAASHCGLCSLHSSTALLGCPRCNSQGLWFNTMVATPVEDTGSKIWQCPHSPPPTSPTISVSVQSVRAVGAWLCPPTFQKMLSLSENCGHKTPFCRSRAQAPNSCKGGATRESPYQADAQWYPGDRAILQNHQNTISNPGVS